LLDVIVNRRSVRFYRNEPVPDDKISEIIQAGFYAPGAHGNQPWHVVIVKDAETRNKLSVMHKWTRHIRSAPVSLVVCVDKRELPQFWVEDAASFMSSLLLEATNQDLGSCWIAIRGVVANGIDSEQTVRELCNIPEHMGILGITPLGYAARHPGPHISTVPEDRVHMERF